MSTRPTNNLKAAVQQLVEEAIKKKTFPCIEILFAQDENIIIHESYGRLDQTQYSPPLKNNFLFDLASLTKPLATTCAVMQLSDSSLLNLHDDVRKFIPEFNRYSKETVTIAHLLTHTSGLPDWIALFDPNFEKKTGWKKLLETKLKTKPGTQTTYSCLGFILLGEVIRRISQVSLTDYCKESIFLPLGLTHLTFNPIPENLEIEIVPTAYCPYRQKMLIGKVHDENAALFDGEGGNSGLFGTAEEIHRFCRMLLNKGTFNGKRILSSTSIELMFENQNPAGLTARTMGWDIKMKNADYWSCGQLMPLKSIGHLGFTGTSLWIDPTMKLIVILLSNRVNISREENIPLMRAFRPELHDLLLSSVL